jgi:pimeloyl-ACP methyl ester carboxylesterase
MAEAQTRLPADGEMRLAGRLVHVVSQPGPSLPVLLLGGCGVPSYTWDDVVELLPDHALVRLDRPGLAGTPWPGTMPRLDSEVETLAALVDAAGGVAVLVAHSMAGPHAEALARRHPELVAALVLVDGSVEWTSRMPAAEGAWQVAARAMRQGMRLPPVRLGTAWVGRVLMEVQTETSLSDAMIAMARKTYGNRESIASVIAEQAAYRSQIADLAQVRAATTWPGLPTTVITAAADRGRRWVADQARLATLLGGQHVVVEDARHLVMLDRPELVADAVRDVHSQAVEDG